jgi:ankyrin repeat protein
MKSVNPKLLYALVGVVALAIGLKLSNPYQKYSTRAFWESATVATVATVPEKVLKPGNPNGGVLMWAAMGAKDPAILKALVDRGADVNESDLIFNGTPVSAAAGKSARPDMITMLVSLGADVNKRVHNGETAAMIAAQYNQTPGIIEALKVAGVDLAARNNQGETALDLARLNRNATVEEALLRQ